MSCNLHGLKKVIIVFLIIGVAYGLLFRPTDDTKGLPDAIWGKPVQFTEASVMPYSSIEQVVSDGQHVYILYTSRKGVVQVFDSDGSYLHSFRLFAHQNGAFMMAVVDSVLYIRDYNADIYVFKDGEFVEFLTNDAADAVRTSIQHDAFEKNTAGYEVKQGSVWYVDGETQKCIVNRPAATGMYQNNVDKLVVVIVLAAIAVMRYMRKSKA